MGSKTKIRGIVLEDKEFEVFAFIKNSVVEIELTEKQKYGLSLLGQTFIQFPPNTDKVQFELNGKLETVEFTKETKELSLSFPECKSYGEVREMTEEEKKELTLAIQKSIQFEPCGKFDQYDDFDEDDEYGYGYE